MAAIALLKRAANKAHIQQSVEGTDDAVIDSIITSTVTTADLYNDANTQVVNLGGSALTTLNLGNGASVTSVDIGTGMGVGDEMILGGAGSTVTIPGDLVVQGTTTSIDSEVVNIADNHLYINAGYTTASAQTGGMVVNYLPTATADTSTTGGFATATTLNTTGAATFAAGDFVQVSGAANAANNGLFEVLTHAANLLTIDATPVEDFTQTAFTVDAGDTTAVLTNVNVSIMRSGTDGIWETASGSSSGLSFSDVGAGAGNSLQAAYVQGNAVSMTDAEGDFAVSVTSGTPAITLDAAGASNFTVDASTLTLSTTTSGALDVTSAGTLDLDATGALSVNSSGAAVNIANDAVSQPVNIATAGDRAVSIGTTGGASTLTMAAGSGGAALDSDAGISLGAVGASDFTVTGAGNDLTLASSLGSVLVSSSEAVSSAVSILAGNAAGGVTIDSGTGGISLGTTGASDFTVTGATADLTLGARGSTITLNESGDTALAGSFTATSIIGALNELIGQSGLSSSYTTTNRTVGEIVIVDGNGSADTGAQANSLANSEGAVGIVSAAAAGGSVVTFGEASALFENGSATPSAGDPIYVSSTAAGRLTGTAPAAGVVFQVGILKSDSGLTAVTVGTDELAVIHIQPFTLIELT